nr:HIT family protein [Bacteroidales bacterium]
ISCKRIGMAVLGMEVPHAHIHLVPLRTEGDLDFRKKKKSLTPEQFKEIAASISNAFNKI